MLGTSTEVAVQWKSAISYFLWSSNLVNFYKLLAFLHYLFSPGLDLFLANVKVKSEMNKPQAEENANSLLYNSTLLLQQ